MNDSELQSRLKNVPLPVRADEYWEDFPARVRSRLRPNPAGQPIRVFPQLVRNAAIAFAILMMVLSLWPISQTVLKDACAFRHGLAKFPDHLRVLMADEHGMHHLIADQ